MSRRQITQSLQGCVHLFSCFLSWWLSKMPSHLDLISLPADCFWSSTPFDIRCGERQSGRDTVEVRKESKSIDEWEKLKVSLIGGKCKKERERNIPWGAEASDHSLPVDPTFCQLDTGLGNDGIFGMWLHNPDVKKESVSYSYIKKRWSFTLLWRQRKRRQRQKKTKLLLKS